ncbi:hypothetical protein KM043_007964 [Ampulex compressa]|nr:hypothetical protein KM043_007964 [Ampulex compressa]
MFRIKALLGHEEFSDIRAVVSDTIHRISKTKRLELCAPNRKYRGSARIGVPRSLGPSPARITSIGGGWVSSRAEGQSRRFEISDHPGNASTTKLTVNLNFSLPLSLESARWPSRRSHTS